MNGAIYVEKSKNSKLGNTDSTYTGIKSSCPNDCSYKNTICYAMTGYVGIVNARLDEEANGLNALGIARAEAAAIDGAYDSGPIPNKDLRLHTSGDSRTIAGSKLINSAIGRWKERGGKDCWSYTHSWKNVPRKVWNNVSMLASISSIKEVALVKKRGYVPAIVVQEYPVDKAYLISGSDIKWIPCPNEYADVQCSKCRLCFDSNRLFKDGFGIAFAVHGVRRNNLKHLPVIK